MDFQRAATIQTHIGNRRPVNGNITDFDSFFPFGKVTQFSQEIRVNGNFCARCTNSLSNTNIQLFLTTHSRGAQIFLKKNLLPQGALWKK